MIINAKFTKIDVAVFISHIDLLRAINKTLRRMGAKVDFSQGFNPHIMLNMSPPLPLGIRSEAEYFSLVLKEDNKDFKTDFNKFSIDGVKISLCKTVEKPPNFSAIIQMSKYIIDYDLLQFKDKISSLLNDGFVVEYQQKGLLVVKDVKEQIMSIDYKNGKTEAIIATGNINLRIDRVIDTLNRQLEITIPITSITKTNQYSVNPDGVLEDVDSYVQ